jgi:hypothetical protein
VHALAPHEAEERGFPLRRSPASQLVHDHWKLILRLTNDEDEGQRLAVHLLETFDQFDAERSTFGQFVKLKLRELRQHYEDKRLVYHPAKKVAGGYISFDEWRENADGEEVSLHDFEPAAPEI